jgi:hypothetical protein
MSNEYALINANNEGRTCFYTLTILGNALMRINITNRHGAEENKIIFYGWLYPYTT